MTEPADASAEGHTALPLKDEEDTLWASLAHLGGVVGFLPSLIIYLTLRQRGKKTAIEAKEALNWQITFFVVWLIVEILIALLGGIIIAATSGLGGNPGNTVTYVLEFIPVALWIVNIVFSILGCVRVNGGGSYRYPFAVRLIK